MAESTAAPTVVAAALAASMVADAAVFAAADTFAKKLDIASFSRT
jgi:hypothetical protein